MLFDITDQTNEAMYAPLRQMGGKRRGPLFPSRVQPRRDISTRQYGRLVGNWVNLIGLDPFVHGTHLLRRTKAALIHRRTGNIRAVQIHLGHAKLKGTVRYLRVEVEAALAIAEQIDVWAAHGTERTFIGFGGWPWWR